MAAARKLDWKGRMASASEAVALPPEPETRPRKNSKMPPSAIHSAAERSITPQARRHHQFTREDFTERLPTGAAEDASRMRRVAPVRAMERIAPKVGPDLMAAANRFHAAILATQGVNTGEIRERVQSSAAPATVQDRMLDAVAELAKAWRALDRVEDEQPRILERDPTLRQIATAVFQMHPDKSFHAIYGDGRPAMRTEARLILALEVLALHYGLKVG